MKSNMYGDITLRIEERLASPIPTIGMGVTECLWSDCYPWEVIAARDSRHITIRKLDYKRTDSRGPYTEHQDYEFSSNPENETKKLFHTKNKGWRERQPDGKLGAIRFAVGHARCYLDPCF